MHRRERNGRLLAWEHLADPERLEWRRIGRSVEDPRPRLLVALRPREDIRDTLTRRLPDVPWAFLEGTPPTHLEDVEAMLVGSLARAGGEFDAKNTPKLAFVQRLYTGIDDLPFERFPERVRIAGNVGAYAPFVAEHAVALALASARDLLGAVEMVRTGRLRPSPAQRVLYGSTAVILGYGEIGREIAHRLVAFGAEIVGMNRTGVPVPGCPEMYPADRLTEVLGRGDFVFEARPLTKRTVGTIGKKELEAMRPEAVFVNVGRAATVDEEALYRHLQGHPSFRAALDVWWNEDYLRGKLLSRFPFTDLPNFVGTPHSAGVAPGTEPRVLGLAIDNLARFFSDGKPRHVVERTEYDP